MGIEPGCTWSSSRRTPRCFSSKRPWNLLSHEIFVSWNLQMISEDGNPQGFYVWMMQPKASGSELYFWWFDPWFKLILRSMKRKLILLLCRRCSNTTKRWPYILLDCWNWLLLLVALYFIRNFINLKILSLLAELFEQWLILNSVVKRNICWKSACINIFQKLIVF